MSFVGSNILAGASGQGGDSGYKIEKSLRFNLPDSTTLSRAFSSAGNRQKWTISFWFKLGQTTGYQYFIHANPGVTPYCIMQMDNNSSTIALYDYSSAGYGFLLSPSNQFRDPSAWQHFVIAFDTTQATASDRVKWYHNGELLALDRSGYTIFPAQNYLTSINQAVTHLFSDSSYGMSSYMADVHFIDSQQLAATDFGKFDSNNVWQAKEYSGTYVTSNIWSNFIQGNVEPAYPLSNLFSGTIGSGYANGSRAVSPGTLTLNVSSLSLTVTNVRLSSYVYGTPSTFSVNGTTVTGYSNGDATSVIAVNGQLNTIAWSYDSGSGPYCYMRGIEVDYGDGNGYQLLTDGTGLNSFHLDFADNVEPSSYSSNTSGNPYTGGGYSWAQVFNGTTTGSVLTYATTNTTCTLPADVTWSSKIRISALNYPDGYIKINGTTLSNLLFTTSQQWVDLTSVLGSSGTLSTIEVGDVGTNYFRLYAVELDGYILKNSNETSGLGKDTSGNANYFTVNNFSVTAGVGNDSLVDTPTNYGDDTGLGGEVRGNYSTLNPLFKLNTAATIVNGNLDTTGGDVAFSTMLLTSGKWYVECTVTGGAGYNLCLSQPDHPAGNTPSSANSKSIGWYTTGGVYWGAGYDYSGSVSYTTGDVLAAAIDMDNTTITWYKNGSSVGNVIDYSTGTYHRFAEGMLVSQFSGQSQWNFGQRAWANTSVPSGYKAMCTQNLPDPTIKNGSKYFDTILWTGQGNTNDRTLTTTTSADLVWTKARNYAYSLPIWDTVRGYGHKELRSNSTGTEGSVNGANFKSSADTSITFEASSNGDNSYYNGGGHSYVGWLWDAGTIGANEVGSYWSPAYNTKYIGFKFPTSGGGRAVFGLESGTGTADIYTSTDNSYWTRVQQNVTLSTTDTTYDSSAQYLIVVNTTNAQWGAHHYAMATNGTDAHYSTSAYPGSGASFTWSGPGYTDWDFRSSGTVIKPGSISSGVPSIASTVRANPSAGFSIASYTGTGAAATVAHGLNAAPEFIITKARSNATNWVTGHSGISWGNFLFLDTTDASGASAAVWNSTAPDSNVFSVASSSYINPSGSGVIAYCFAPVEGYSKFGKYIGNGSADGPFIYTGFRPAWLLIKDTTSAYNWLVFDSERSTYNIVNNVLHPNDLMTENGSGAFNWLDFTSNGFKHRNTGLWHNKSGDTYIYAAFAENPFKTARAR